jgi:transposase
MSSEVEISHGTIESTATRGFLDFARNDGAEAPSHLETFAEVKLSADRIVDEKIFCAFAFHTAIENQISAVHDGESLTHVVIRDHDG